MLSGDRPLHRDKTNNIVSVSQGLSLALSSPIAFALVFFTLAVATAKGSPSHP